MNIIKINNASFEVENYNRNIYFNAEGVSSTGSCNLVTNNVTALRVLAEDPITSIEIRHDDNLIYELHNLDAKIESIYESFSGDRIYVTVNFVFETITQVAE